MSALLNNTGPYAELAMIFLYLSVILISTAIAILAISLSFYLYRQWTYKKQIQHLLTPHKDNNNTQNQLNSPLDQALDKASSLGERWKHGRFGSALLAQEDSNLIDMAGYDDISLARSLFIFSRGLLVLCLPALFLFFSPSLQLGHNKIVGIALALFLGFSLGWMLPKWYLNNKIKQRKKAVNNELPLFLDILRLLQGVGLSIDQSLLTIVERFKSIIPVLVYELSFAQEQYARGRSREQSFHRLTTLFENDELTAICRLIQQIDTYGGAVQEPLERFSLRIQEKRKLYLKEQVGKLTVKMTGVMILTLMPALVIVTGGSGFLAVMRGLSSVSAGGM